MTDKLATVIDRRYIDETVGPADVSMSVDGYHGGKTD
jgi:hypothetical protein